VSVAAVVVAAGRGLRFGGPKQFAQLRDETVTAHSIRAARSVAARVVLVVPSDYDGAALVEAFGGRVVVVPGEVDNIKITLPGDLDKVAANEGGLR
jgi:2-C-methyl-D-erythritol 4-phosphate cytidylyltransferase